MKKQFVVIMFQSFLLLFSFSLMTHTVALATTPSHWDWRDAGMVTPVKNQGFCGSCWAHAVLAAVESKILILGGPEMDLSEQQLISCSGQSTGCSGGDLYHALSYIRDHGVVSESCFPYQAANIACNLCSATSFVKIEGFYRVVPYPPPDLATEIQYIKEAIYNDGPVVMTMSIGCSWFWNYTGGIFDGCDSAGSMDAVLTVGWDDPEDYWIVKHSFDTWFGEDGYQRIKRTDYSLYLYGIYAVKRTDYNGDGIWDGQSIIANAGPDQTVNEGAMVVLNGSWSSGQEGLPLSYIWTQIAGPAVNLNLTDPPHPTFIAPEVTAGGATLTFQLTVTDSSLTSEPDVVNIVVKNVNHTPFPDAGDDQSVKEGSSVTLNGSDSYDSDLDTLIFTWIQISGPSVVLSDPSSPKPLFTAPLVGPGGAKLTFQLTVWDGIDSVTDTVEISIENMNHPPEAKAGEDQTKSESSMVTLDGTASGDPDGDTLTFTWIQISGPSVVLSDPSSPIPSFTAPFVSPEGEGLVFRLTVDDGLGGVSSDDVIVQIVNVNNPPNCALAVAKPAVMWPPDHTMIPIIIANVADPDNNGVTITISGVTQDEPVNGLGDGDTSPDAVVSGSNILIRAERAGTGDGRVYKINFRAIDSLGEGCTGSVTVCVPHSRKPASCINSDKFFDSFGQ